MDEFSGKQIKDTIFKTCFALFARQLVKKWFWFPLNTVTWVNKYDIEILSHVDCKISGKALVLTFKKSYFLLYMQWFSVIQSKKKDIWFFLCYSPFIPFFNNLLSLLPNSFDG